MDRRSFLVAAAALTAGCGSDGSDPTETTGATDATDSPTFVTPTGTQPPTPDDDAEVRQAIEGAREASSLVLRRIEVAGVVEDGRPGIVSEDGSVGRSEALSAAEELTVAARERLEAVSAHATGEQAQAVERLLRVTLYLRAKRFTHRSLLNAFLDYQLGQSQLRRNPTTATETFQNGLRHFERTGSFRSRATDRLETVVDRHGTVAVEGFDPEAERTELRAIGRIVDRFRPSCRGLAAFTRLARAVGRAELAYRREGDLREARAEFRLAATHASDAETAFRTALDRGIPTVTENRELACQTVEYREGAETAAAAMEEFLAGDDAAGEKLFDRYLRTYEQAGEVCSDGEQSGTSTGTT